MSWGEVGTVELTIWDLGEVGTEVKTIHVECEGWVSREVTLNYEGWSSPFFDQLSGVVKLSNLEWGHRYLAKPR